MSERRCENCRFWKARAETWGGVPVGECRRYPSQPDPRGAKPRESLTPNDYHYPRATAEEWCGEWRPKPTGIDAAAESLATAVLLGDRTAVLALRDRLTELEQE